MKGGNRRDFISQVDRLIAVRHGGEAASGHDHPEFARKSVQRVEEFRFRSQIRMSNIRASSDRSEGIMLRAVVDHLDRHLFEVRVLRQNFVQRFLQVLRSRIVRRNHYGPEGARTKTFCA
jgi:hypothetical protein